MPRRSVQTRPAVSPPEPSVYDDGYLRVEYDHYYVAIDGRYVRLLLKEFQIISHLARNCSRFVSVEELWRAVWKKRTAPNLNTINVNLCRTRRRLAPFKIQIETRPKDGYRLVTERRPN